MVKNAFILLMLFISQFALARTACLVLMGAPGSGKGSLVNYLEARLPCQTLTISSLLKAKASAEDGSSESRLISECIRTGQLVPKEIPFGLLKHEFERATQKSGVIIIDGFIQSKEYIDFLFGLLKDRDLFANTIFLNLDTDRATVEKRLRARGRVDDSEATIAKRLDRYYRDSPGLLKSFQSLPSFVNVDANRPLADLERSDYLRLAEILKTKIVDQTKGRK